MPPTRQPNPSFSSVISNLSNTITVLSGLMSVASFAISAVYVFGVYKTRMEALDKSYEEIKKDIRDVDKELTIVKERQAGLTAAVNIKLYNSPLIQPYQTPTP